MANWSAYQESIVGLPVEKRAKHGLHFKRPDGLIQGEFVGSPCHYLDTDKLWKPIDTALKAVGAEYGAPGLPIRFRLDGRVAVGTHVQQTIRIGLFNPTTRAFSLLATLPDGMISDDKIIRESGIFREEITLKEGGVREELIVASMPSGGAGDWLVLETRIQGGDFSDGDTAEFSREGYQFPLPSVRDANSKRLPAKRFARKIGAAQYLLTGVPLAALAGAAFPVTIDPDFSGSTNDGHIYGADAVYATARSTSAAYNMTDVIFLVGQWLQGGGSYVPSRGFLKFDTSSIGAGATVSQVNLKLVCTVDDSLVDFDVTIMKQDWSAQDPVSAANRETAYDNCLAGTPDDNIWRNTSGMSINTQYASGNLATTWINKSGNTYYSAISSRELSSSVPTDVENVSIATTEHATSAYRPVLTVVYSSFQPRPGAVNFGGLAVA